MHGVEYLMSIIRLLLHDTMYVKCPKKYTLRPLQV